MFKELAVPVVLLAVLGSMLLPVPPLVLDFLLVSNLLLGLMLLVSAFYISDSLKLSSLPGMLLLATLFRLGLNVATTRSILGTGEAGQTIEAFGHVVIGGNLVVGIVVFLVVTLIQFIVIAKGSERVAEVAARFTLDAMPGKQMSIDADVRAGLIDFETARKRRNEMQTESRFYGALDGAMKFIKGDAIAGIVIAAVNIIGGLAAGILIEGLDAGSAVQKYTLLTIGDGMVSQIPALLNALAAGMIVTRVGKGENETLAQELLGQIGQVKRAKYIIAAVAAFMAFMPGMPAAPFLFVGVLLSGSAFFSAPKKQIKTDSGSQVVFEPKTPAVLHIEIEKTLAAHMQQSGNFSQKLFALRNEIYQERGLILGLPEIMFTEGLKHSFVIRVRGVPAIKKLLADERKNEVVESIAAALEMVINRRAEDLVDDLLTRRTLDYFEKEGSELIAALVPEVVKVTTISEILKCLVREGISIRNFDVILQAVAEASQRGISGSRQLLEEVRVALKRMISARHCDEEGKMKVVLVDPAIDLSFVKAEREGHLLEPDLISHLVSSVECLQVPGAVILTSKSSRHLIKECLQMRKLPLPVLAHEEISDDVEFDVVGRIEVPTPELEEQIIDRLAA